MIFWHFFIPNAPQSVPCAGCIIHKFGALKCTAQKIAKLLQKIIQLNTYRLSKYCIITGTNVCSDSISTMYYCEGR